MGGGGGIGIKRRQRVCCSCFMAHRPSSAVGRGVWGDFQFRVLEGQVVYVV